jgi:hypothetical protein
MKTIHVKDGDRIKIGETEIEIKLIPVTTLTWKLMGKWVRALQETAHGTKINHWYPVMGKDENGWIIPTGSITDDFGWKENRIAAYFDIDNPCDFDPNMPEAINPKYKVGDKVVVVDRGLTFSGWKEAFWFFGLKEKQINESFDNNTKAQVIGVSKHTDKDNINWNIYALRDSNGNECVIGEAGIELVEVVNKEEWLAAASRLLDSWREISGGYVSKENETCYFIRFNIKRKELWVEYLPNYIYGPFCFNHEHQIRQFLSENKTDLKVYYHIHALN